MSWYEANLVAIIVPFRCDNGTCIPFIYGCTDDTMFNYNPDANTDFDGLLCVPFTLGCTDPDAFNYDKKN